MDNVVPMAARKKSGGNSGGGNSANQWLINSDEERALRELGSARAVVLYVLGLRPYMDYSTGMVGAARRVSYQMFSELLEEQRERGSTFPTYKPTINQIRWLIDKLESGGLLRKLPRQTKKSPMLFRLLLATTGLIRSNEEQQKKVAHEQHEEQQKKSTKTNIKNMRLEKSKTHEQHDEQQKKIGDEPHTSGNSNTTEFTKVNSESVTGVTDGSNSANGIVVSDSASSRQPACPHTKILEIWDEVMPATTRRPKPALWTSGRAAHKNLTNRWKQCFGIRHSRTGAPLYSDVESGLLWWRGFFEYCKRSQFLMNQCRNFDLPWLVKRENFIKIQEGNYHDAP